MLRRYQQRIILRYTPRCKYGVQSRQSEYPIGKIVTKTKSFASLETAIDSLQFYAESLAKDDDWVGIEVLECVVVDRATKSVVYYISTPLWR